MEYIVKTPLGLIRGTNSKNEGVIAFKGIRYAIANRFEYSKLIEKYDDIYDATEYKNCSYQPRSFYNE